jgi:hypothetical protein
MTAPFFWSWWAVVTGVATLFALFAGPQEGVWLSPLALAIVVLVASGLVFLVLSTLSRGWELFVARDGGLRVISFERNRHIAEGWVFILEGNVHLDVGSVIDVHKQSGAAEVPLALLKVVGRNDSGAYQALPIGQLNPVHVREHSAGGLRVPDLIVRKTIDAHRLRENADALR